MRNYNSRYVYNENFLHYPQISRILECGGYKAHGLLYIVCDYLKHCKYGIGFTRDLRIIAHKAKIRSKSLNEWMKETELFVFNDEKGLFICPCYRHYFGIDDFPSEEEIDDVVKNGNIYIGKAKKNDDEDDEQVCKDDLNSVKDEEECNTSSTLVKLQNSQDTEAEDVTPSPYNSKDEDTFSDISLQSSENTDKYTITSTAGAEKAEVEGGVSFDFFRKNLLSNQEWLDKISKIRCVNVWDKDEAEVFARWMYDYSTCYGIVYKDADAMRHHAFCLLAQGRNTRKMFDAYVKEELKKLVDERARAETEEYESQPNFEYVEHGHRYAFHGEMIPRYAPPQPGNDVRWSYIRDRWVPLDGYDAEKEWRYARDMIRKLRDEAGMDGGGADGADTADRDDDLPPENEDMDYNLHNLLG